MSFLRRVAGVASLWLPVVAAILVCCAVSAWRQGGQPQPEATVPAPPLRPGEWRGPSADELIDRFQAKAPHSARRASLIE